MTDIAKKTPRRKILLATDLGSSCDRAFDRALQLAKNWNVELHVNYAIPEDQGN